MIPVAEEKTGETKGESEEDRYDNDFMPDEDGGWVHMWDDSSGREYWLNELTGEGRWAAAKRGPH